MFSISDPKLKSIGKDIIEGRGHKAIKDLDILLDTKLKSPNEKIDYQLLRIQALIDLGEFKELECYFKEIWEEIQEYGTELQQLDLLLFRSKFFIDLQAPDTTRFSMVKDLENIILNSNQKETNPYLERKVIFLNYMKNLTTRQKDYDSQRPNYVKDALKLSEEIDYDYGLVLSAISSVDEMEKGDWDDVFELLNKAKEKCEQKGFMLLLGRVLTQLANLYWVKLKQDMRYNFLNEANQIFKKIDAKKYLAENHNNFGFYYHHFSEYEKCMKHFELGYDIARIIGYKAHEVTILHNIGTIYLMKMEYSKAIPYFEKGLALAQEIESHRFPALFLRGLGIMYTQIGELNKALKYLHVGFDLVNERDNKNDIATLHSCLMIAYLAKGELNKALEYSSAIEYYEEAENFWLLAECFRYRGEIYQMMGDRDKAIENFNLSLEVARKIKNEIRLAEVYFSYISYYLENKDLENAKTNVKLLEEVSESTEEKIVYSRVLLAKALILKSSENLDDKYESIKLFEEVIKIEDISFNLLIVASLSLCEVLILKLKESENQELLTKLYDLTESLHVKAIQNYVYSVIVQTVWLQSQIALLEMDVNKARILMSKAQAIAEEHDFEKLAIKISNTHDVLLEQLDIWESMLTELPAIAERLELTHIETILQEMIRGKGIVLEESEKEEETPVLLFITSEKGSILYSEQFDTSLDIQTINKILPEILNKEQEELDITAIDRSTYQEYNYLLKRLENISFCYMFIGKSYEGMKKLNQFSELVFESSQIWNQLSSITEEASSFESTTRVLLNQFVDRIFA
jgi:tetratricopeptide (TPR) repeat protein